MTRARRESKYGRAHISGGPKPKSKTRFAGEREGLAEALMPMKQQPGNRKSPYFVGMDESSWSDMVDNLHEGIRSGYLSINDVQSLLKSTPTEAERFFNYSSARKYNRSGRSVGYKYDTPRHKARGVPHAFSSENVYNELLKANGFNSRLNNEVDDLATDLITEINGKDRLIDVQNRSGRGKDAVSLGLIQGLYDDNSGIGLRTYADSSDKAKLSQIFEDTRSNMLGGMTAKNIDKLSASVDFTPNGYGKEMLIGGRYQPGDVTNVMNQPQMGSYDFVQPREVDLIDLNKLRNEMMQMTKQDLINQDVTPVFKAQDKLKFTIPMELVNSLGALNNGMIDPELIKLVRR
tara:strand:- start:725 stop:1768 length:1044 start_codon:yes stop_codon:yes gene_type:complete